MRIALLSYEYPPDTGFGGIGTYTWYQARALVRLGHDVRVVAGSVVPGVFESEVDGVRLTRVLDPGPFAGAVAGLEGDGLPWSANRLRTAAGAFRALRRLLEQETYDIVEYPECGADGMLAASLPVNTCVRFHSPSKLIMEAYGADPRDIETASAFEQVGINQASTAISPSAFLAEEVKRHLGVQTPISVVPNGIDLDRFDLDDGIDVVERFGLDEGAVTVLFTGRLERRKGADVLPQVCEDLLRRRPEVHIVLAGADDGGLVAESITPRLARLGLEDRLHPLGRVGMGEVRALLKQADVFLLPSVWENMPYSCIEAMAASRAIVASNVGGIPELIADGTSGLLVPTGDPVAVVDALVRLVEDRELRDRLGAAARRRVEENHRDVDVAARSVDLWKAGLPGAAPQG